MTFPTTSATIARTDAAQAFTGVQTFGAIGAGFQIISTTLSLYVSFGARVRLADGLVVLPSNGTLRFWSGTNLDTGAADTFLGRKAAANIQLGVDAASPVNQTISGPSGVGSDKVGGNLTIEGGASTGTGRGGDLSLKTAISSTTGSTANSLSTRLYNSAKFVDLTEATATQFASITIAAATYIGLRVACTVFASDGTDHQALDTEFTVSAVNKAGTLTISAVTQYDGAVCNSAGTLTPVTYTAVASGNNLLLKCAATSSLTQTTLRVKWSILSCNSNDVATVTPS
jgi:hypothetical protein